MDENTKYDTMDEETLDEAEYEKALEDFTKRLMIVELPKNTEEPFTKHVKNVSGIACVLAIINHEANLITPLPDSFEAPYDNITMWNIAVKNSTNMSTLNDEASKPNDNIYVIMSHSGRGVICCDEFWNMVCEKLNTMRLVVSMYHKDNNKSYILASILDDTEKMDMRTYLHQVNKEDDCRISYVFVRNVGMLSEAALNSER